MTDKLPRRRFLGAAALGAATLPLGLRRILAAQTPDPDMASSIPIIDTHIHLYDPTRPEGIPWPGRNDTLLYQPTLPSRYRSVIEGFNVVGAIEVECSARLEDNQWVLDVAEADPIMVGTVGNLEPGKPEFARQLERFHANPLFRGIRYGNLWGRNLVTALNERAFVADLKLLAEADLVLDTANPTPELLAAVVRLTDLVPNLRVVVDHLPKLLRPDAGDARALYDSSMRELGARPQVYVKVSGVLRREDGEVPLDLDFYQPKLDEIFDLFGADRLLFGSDWPHSDQWGSFDQVLALVRGYFMAKGREVAEKYFWRNSVAAYRWVARTPAQRALA